MKNNFSEKQFSFFNPKNKKIKKETESSSSTQLRTSVQSQLMTMRIEAAKISTKESKISCKYCEKFENAIRFCTSKCLRKFRWFRDKTYRSEKTNPTIDTNGCPFCCECVNCEERITTYRKMLSETPNSCVISNRRSRLKTELSEETEELIPDILQSYISLILSSSEKKIVTLLQSTMYLLPDVMLISNGQQVTIDLEATQIFGTLKLMNDSFCTVICRGYEFKEKTEQKIFCLCSCQYKPGTKIKSTIFNYNFSTNIFL